ncbi:type II secretion system protein [Leptothrix discophora]|uniref:Type II secretion system protein n=1 Tax=Leptothrix discophora TaxID=89 RepID=A0ABT9G236_LEPDI|nr:type II secretion system protein [Leptothrix discophora]MDP4300550.1 type II secretion system protein [Leptothrix discophora]
MPRRPPPGTAAPHSRRGAVLLGFLVLLAASGWTVANWGQAAADERQRDAEAELLWVGQQYRAAIESYYNATPGGVKKLPVKVEELLEDKRFPTSRRHLRQAYGDPLKPGEPIKLILRAEQIVGVRSAATGLPFRRTGFPAGLEKFAEAESYADWQFVVNIRGINNLPGAPADAASGAAGSNGFGSPGSSPLQGFSNPSGGAAAQGNFGIGQGTNNPSSPLTPLRPSTPGLGR